MRRLLSIIVFGAIIAPASLMAAELQCPTYAEGQQHRSCILTELSNCNSTYPDCDSDAFVTTTNLTTANVQSLCCPKGSTTARNKCFKRQRRFLNRAKGLDSLFRKKLREIITGYLTSDTVCGEE